MLKALYIKWVMLLKFEVSVLVLLFKHAALPKMAKFLVFFLLSYILSPIDVIPDFIPLLGKIDDFSMIFLIMWMIKRITPLALLSEVREEVKNNPNLNIFKGRKGKMILALILALWVFITFFAIKLIDFEMLLQS